MSYPFQLFICNLINEASVFNLYRKLNPNLFWFCMCMHEDLNASFGNYIEVEKR